MSTPSIYKTLKKQFHVFIHVPDNASTPPELAQALDAQGCTYCPVLGGWIAKEDCNKCLDVILFDECQS